MILPLHEQVRARVRDALARLHGITDADLTIPIEYPPNRTLGDLGTPVAFDLARRLRKAPRAIAQELAAALGPIPGVAADRRRAERLSQRLPRSAGVPARRAWAWRARCRRRPRGPKRPSSSTPRSIRTRPRTSGTSATPRSATRWCACCKFRGNPVEVQNYIDDTGVQVADVVVGFRELEKLDLDDAQRIAATTRFDYYCWDLYARVTEWYEGDKERLKIRAATLHDIEHGVDPDGQPRRVHRRHRGARPPEDDGAAQHRLPAADVGRRHPAAAVLGARVRGAASRPARCSCRPRARTPAAGS